MPRKPIAIARSKQGTGSVWAGWAPGQARSDRAWVRASRKAGPEKGPASRRGGAVVPAAATVGPLAQPYVAYGFSSTGDGHWTARAAETVPGSADTSPHAP